MNGKVLELCRVFRNAENLFLIKKNLVLRFINAPYRYHFKEEFVQTIRLVDKFV